jgi:hypothetical protein
MRNSLVSDGVPVAETPAAAGDWWGEAERCRRLVQLEPLKAAHWSNLANALWLHGEPEPALPAARRAVALDPAHPVVWRCLANVLQDLGCFEDSLAAYERSLCLLHDPATAFSASKVLQGLGRFEQAYLLAEQRLSKPGFSVYRPGPYWQGWPQVQRLWVWSEQGFGDVLQHLRWLVPLLQRGCRVTLELEPALVPLVAEGLRWAGSLHVQPREAVPPPLPAGACHGPLLSLPGLLGGAPLRELGSCLRLPIADSSPARQRPRVGLIWASGQFLDRHVLEREYRRKSLLGPPLQSLLNALATRPLDLVALQFGADRQAPPWIGRFAAELPLEADFAVQARWLQTLDLVLSVDTAAAHLAGTLGLPVWILLPWAAEARWQRGRSDTPWYPSMHLLRQPANNDWYGLVRLLLAQLDLWLTSRLNSAS